MPLFSGVAGGYFALWSSNVHSDTIMPSAYRQRKTSTTTLYHQNYLSPWSHSEAMHWQRMSRCYITYVRCGINVLWLKINTAAKEKLGASISR